MPDLVPDYTCTVSQQQLESKVCDDAPLAAATTYVFDHAYNNASFWADIHAAEAFFVSRPNSNLAYDVVSSPYHSNTMIVADETIVLTGNSGKKYDLPLRRIEVFDAEKSVRSRSSARILSVRRNKSLISTSGDL